MKKLIFSFCLCLATALGVQAQKLGDYMVIDGVPSFVFYVDDTGEHGLVMSMPMPISKTLLKRLNKWVEAGIINEEQVERLQSMHNSANELIYDMKKVPYFQALKSNKNFRAELFGELVPRLGEEGEANATAIKEYCEEKGLSMETCFPWEFWAAQLGDGWFIPGDKELELFATFFCGGLGKENSMGSFAYAKRYREATDNMFISLGLFQITCQGLGLISSTSKIAECGFRKLEHIKTKMPPKDWFDLYDRVGWWNAKNKEDMKKALDAKEELRVYTCAVHKF